MGVGLALNFFFFGTTLTCHAFTYESSPYSPLCNIVEQPSCAWWIAPRHDCHVPIPVWLMWLPRPLPLRRVLQSFSAHPGPGAVELHQTDVPFVHVSFLDFVTNRLPFLSCFHGYQIASGPLTFLPAVRPRQTIRVKRVTGATLRSSCSRDKAGH